MAVSRRAAIGTLAGTAVAVSTGTAFALVRREPTREEREFIEAIAFLHPNGRAAAVHALELGLSPRELYQVDLISGSASERPQLRFNKGDERRHVFVTPIDFHHEPTGVSVARAI